MGVFSPTFPLSPVVVKKFVGNDFTKVIVDIFFVCFL